VSGYACGDGDATMALHARLKAEIEAQNLRKVFSVESELTPVLHRMSRRGWKIDEDRLHLVFEMANAKLEHAQRELPENLNVRSPIQMEKIFTDAGFKDWPHTQTGRASFPEAWLLTNLLGQRIVEARKWRTLLSTFIVPIMDEHLWKGRVHTNFNQLKADDYGTVTGRLSSNDPNMFNSPSPKKNPDQADLFRQIFIGDDGSEIVEQDMDQQEVRICAHFAQIKAWLDGYNSDPPIDAHSAVATATGLSRQNAKIINLALIMGAGMESTIQRLGMPYDDGRNVVLQYHEKVPELKAFQKFAANKWKQHGFIRSILGRRFRLIDDQKAYNALNRIVQGSAADICKLALTKCAKIGGVELINSIYDSIIYQRVDPRLDDDVTEAMCNHPELKLKVPLLTSFGSGGRWSDIG
jgi:DNA polymerase-1